LLQRGFFPTHIIPTERDSNLSEYDRGSVFYDGYDTEGSDWDREMEEDVAMTCQLCWTLLTVSPVSIQKTCKQGKDYIRQTSLPCSCRLGWTYHE
jgi:hypothetical protein